MKAMKMDAVLNHDLQEFDVILDEVKAEAMAFLATLDNLSTYAFDQEPTLSFLPEVGLGTLASMKLFGADYQKRMVASAGPRYWGFVTGGTTPAGLAGDWLTSTFDQNTQSLQGAGDVSAQIEFETIKLLLKLLNLPDDFNGGFVTGATMSNFTGLAVARQWAGERMGKDIARDGMLGEIVVLGATPHSSVIKCLAMLGFGSAHFKTVKTLEGREAIDVADLESKLIQFGKQPVIVNCSAGTVNTVDFDDIETLVHLKAKYHFWLHIDAAFGGFAACSPDFEHLLCGWEQADSITVDCHKWMNVPYDSAVIFTRKEHKHLQIQTFRNTNAPYLGETHENFSYLNFLPENSRRFRALPAWFSLMAYGRLGLRSIVCNSVHCARGLGNYLEQSDYFSLLAPVRLNVVCFTLNESVEKTATFLSLLNSRGQVFMTPTSLDGKVGIRAAFVNYRTSIKDVEKAIAELEAVGEQMGLQVMR